MTMVKLWLKLQENNHFEFSWCIFGVKIYLKLRIVGKGKFLTNFVSCINFFLQNLYAIAYIFLNRYLSQVFEIIMNF